MANQLDNHRPTTSHGPARDYVAGAVLRLLSTDAATNTTVSTSAITLIAACGDGFQPRSVNPNRPVVRESAKAISVPDRKQRAGPPKPLRCAGKDQHGQRAKHAGLQQECRPYRGDVVVAVDVQVGVDDAADGQRGRDAESKANLARC